MKALQLFTFPMKKEIKKKVKRRFSFALRPRGEVGLLPRGRAWWKLFDTFNSSVGLPRWSNGSSVLFRRPCQIFFPSLFLCDYRPPNVSPRVFISAEWFQLCFPSSQQPAWSWSEEHWSLKQQRLIVKIIIIIIIIIIRLTSFFRVHCFDWLVVVKNISSRISTKKKQSTSI